MQKKQIMIVGVLVFVLALACGSSAPETTDPIAPTQPLPSSTETAVPTNTVRPTNTPSPTETPQPQRSERCIPASEAQLDGIRNGIKDIDPNNDIVDGWAVRSNDFERVYIVAAEIHGAGIRPGEAIGVWAISGDLDSPGLFLAVDGFAKGFSPYPDASKTTAEITISSDGVEEAKECYMSH